MAYLADCIASGWISSRGGYVARLENEIAAWCGVAHGVAVSSGTAALHLALLALGIGPGDEVIVPALTYVASANVVAYTGATPVFVDVDSATWNLDPAQIAGAITPRTQAIMAVHLYGHPLDMAALRAIADRHGVSIVEDASEALGARFGTRPVGGLGEVGCFSFFGNKVITTGEGGCVVTDSADLAATIRSLRNQAHTGTAYHYSRIGYNYQMTNLQAAVGVAQMERLESFLAARRGLSAHYDMLFGGVPGLRLYSEPAWAESVCWLYSLLVEPAFPRSRDAVIASLRRHNIESKPFFEPLPSLSMYRNGKGYPAAEYLARTGISLPTSVKRTSADLERIARIILEGA